MTETAGIFLNYKAAADTVHGSAARAPHEASSPRTKKLTTSSRKLLVDPIQMWRPTYNNSSAENRAVDWVVSRSAETSREHHRWQVAEYENRDSVHVKRAS